MTAGYTIDCCCLSLLPEAHQPDSPKEPQVSFAILTANENKNVTVHHFLKLGNPTDTTKYHYASSDDSSLKQAKAKIKPNEGKSENPYHVFDLEVDEKRQRVSSCGMQHDGSLGGL